MRSALAIAAAATILSLSACGGTDAEPVAAPATSTSSAAPATETTPDLKALLIDVPDLPSEDFAGYTRSLEAEAKVAKATGKVAPKCAAAGERPKAQQYSDDRVFEGTSYKPWVAIIVNDYGTSDQASKALDWNRGRVTACPDAGEGSMRSAVVPPSGHPDYVVVKMTDGNMTRLDTVAQRGRFIIVAYNTAEGTMNNASNLLTKAVEIQSVKLGTSA